MSARRIALRFAVFLLVLGGAVDGRADTGVLQVIDIRAIHALHGGGNLNGLAYDPGRNVYYVSQEPFNPPEDGHIYTLDANGNLLKETNFSSVYQVGADPTTLSYDVSTGHLFVFAEGRSSNGTFVLHLVEFDPVSFAKFSDILLDPGGGQPDAVIVRSDGLWQSSYPGRSIRHYTSAGVALGDISVSHSFLDPSITPGSGPFGLATYFRGGFFLIDVLSSRVIEVDGAGNEIAEGSTRISSSECAGCVFAPRPFAIASDVAGQRIFVQVENDLIYVLSPAFMQAYVNSLVRLNSVSNSYNATPVLYGQAGTLTITATFQNTSSHSMLHPVFLVKFLSEAWVLLNADGGPGERAGELTPNVGSDGVLAPGESFTAKFVVGLFARQQFNFVVDLLAESVQ